MNRPLLLFASYHCYHDPASGAALCTRDLFAALAARGYPCSVFTGPYLDDPAAPPATLALRDRPGVRSVRGTAGPYPFTLHRGADSGVPVTVFATDPPVASQPPTPVDTAAFLAVFRDHLARFRPDVVLTYGGDPASRGLHQIAREAGAKVVFWLHNFAYRDPFAFADCDAVVVPSEFSRAYHRDTIGLDCTVLAPVIDQNRVHVGRPDGGRFVTFVNPEPNKGVFWFARIADVLGRTRPEIPLLVVEGRGRTQWLNQTGIDWRENRSIHRMPNSPDPRAFYRLSKLMLMPSLWRESFGLVSAESQLNGIPVIASDRGALPEVVGSGGLCLPIPASVTPESRTPPTAEDVAPWVDAIIDLCDDPHRYATASAAARAASERWLPETTLPNWEQFLCRLTGPVVN